ncbi:GNAT family N-acetyltransferase [Shewanella sp. NIFS-20-20]|uniref:GNAT family N-acetyltransferase n=1 Tax=Shewanella sp. NIFS-20-20 TaxID=2853806 RepID=UPI001C486FE3|nr:GNAT family N-acetyltransferase [Shewanella sp. NIFS-20-20]MBV7315906.1 N-acetyltransferase [Shewanella sp. NIFS-20-20]
MAVEHQTQQHRFVWQAAELALLEYTIAGDTINFTHTYVPESLRGQGIAEQLVRAGLAWAKAENYQIEARCWYVQKFLK